MEKFTCINDLGIEYECDVLATLDIEDDLYVIYTDFTFGEDNNLNIFVKKVVNDKMVDIGEQLEKVIINSFKKAEIGFFNKVREVKK